MLRLHDVDRNVDVSRVALEYAHVASCVASTIAWATLRSKPGKLTFSRARRK